MRDLLASGLSVQRVADASRVSVATVGRWKSQFGHLEPKWRPDDEARYAYLLGMYLGDGCLYEGRSGGVLLRVTLDAIYPVVIRSCAEAMQACMPHNRTGVVPCLDRRAVYVQCSTRRWLLAFPQHGPGRKHLREIRLEHWQAAIVRRQHAQFVRGLIHSDGCRTINAFKTSLPSGRVAEYAYPRYFFSNMSEDIRDLFCASCDALGVRWTQSNPRNISISHRHSVAVLDEIGCAKD